MYMASRRELNPLHGIHQYYRHEVKPHPRDAVYKDLHVMCVDSLYKSDGVVYGDKTNITISVIFNYEVSTNIPLDDEIFMNNYLPRIKDLFAQSFFKDHPLCCDYLRPMAKPSSAFTTSVISMISGVDATIFSDRINSNTKCAFAVEGDACKVVSGSLLLYLTDQDVILEIDSDKTTKDAIKRVELYMSKDFYACAHPMISSLVFRNDSSATKGPTTLPTRREPTIAPTLTKEIAFIEEPIENVVAELLCCTDDIIIQCLNCRKGDDRAFTLNIILIVAAAIAIVLLCVGLIAKKQAEETEFDADERASFS